MNVNNYINYCISGNADFKLLNFTVLKFKVFHP